jgi:hypothetical protein
MGFWMCILFGVQMMASGDPSGLLLGPLFIIGGFILS